MTYIYTKEQKEKIMEGLSKEVIFEAYLGVRDRLDDAKQELESLKEYNKLLVDENTRLKAKVGEDIIPTEQLRGLYDLLKKIFETPTKSSSDDDFGL